MQVSGTIYLLELGTTGGACERMWWPRAAAVGASCLSGASLGCSTCLLEASNFKETDLKKVVNLFASEKVPMGFR